MLADTPLGEAAAAKVVSIGKKRAGKTQDEAEPTSDDTGGGGSPTLQ